MHRTRPVVVAALFSAVLTPVAAAQLEEEWVVVHDGAAAGSDEFHSATADDMGVTVVGNVSEYVASRTDFGVLRFSADGSLDWSVAYDGPTNGNDYGAAVDVAADGTVHAVGYGYSSGIPNTRLHVVRVAPGGTQQLGMTWTVPGSYSNIGVDVAAAPDGGTIVTGWTTDLGDPTDVVTLRVGPTGAVEWHRVWDGPQSSYDNVFDLALDSLGNAVVLGRTDAAVGADDVAVLKYGPDGTLLWDLVWGGPGGAGATMPHLVIQDDDSIVIGGHGATGGTGDRDLVLARITPGGAVDWVWTWAGEDGENESMQGLVRDAAGDLYLTGDTTTVATGDDVVTARVDSAGEEAWIRVRTVDDVYPWDDGSEGIALGPDGRVHVAANGIRALGSGGGDGPPHEYGRWLIRYAADGSFDTELFTPSPGFTRDLDVAPDGTIYTVGDRFDATRNGLVVRTVDLFVDCNGNGIHDPEDIAGGKSSDCNGNGVPDECDTAGGTSLDCDADGIPDECLIAEDPAADADGTGVLDACEAAGDLDGSGAVDLGDLLLVLAAWGDCEPGEACPADLDGDGVVGMLDLLQILAGWGA